MISPSSRPFQRPSESARLGRRCDLPRVRFLIPLLSNVSTWRPFFVLLTAIVSLAGLCGCGDASKPPRARHQVDSSEIRVIDGDTITYRKSRIRILGLDAPEIPWTDTSTMPSPFVGDQGEAALQARDHLESLIRNAKTVELAFLDNTDKYGRLLGHVYLDGVPVAIPMIKARLAYETVSRYGHQGFEEEASQILEAATSTPAPDFENPHDWRRRNATKPRED